MLITFYISKEESRLKTITEQLNMNETLIVAIPRPKFPMEGGLGRRTLVVKKYVKILERRRVQTKIIPVQMSTNET